jgi:hypothetical protein
MYFGHANADLHALSKIHRHFYWSSPTTQCKISIRTCTHQSCMSPPGGRPAPASVHCGELGKQSPNTHHSGDDRFSSDPVEIAPPSVASPHTPPTLPKAHMHTPAPMPLNASKKSALHGGGGGGASSAATLRSTSPGCTVEWMVKKCHLFSIFSLFISMSGWRCIHCTLVATHDAK